MGKLKTFAPKRALENKKMRERAAEAFADSFADLANKPFQKMDFEALNRSLAAEQQECERIAKLFEVDPKTYEITFNI